MKTVWEKKMMCHGKGRIVKSAMEKKGNGSKVTGQLPFLSSQNRVVSTLSC